MAPTCHVKSATISTLKTVKYSEMLPMCRRTSCRSMCIMCVTKLTCSVNVAVGGHDSQEDAAACMELMLWKVKDDAKKSGRRS